MERDDPPPNRRYPWILAGAGLAALPALLAAVPLEWLDGAPSVCLYRNVTGEDCPGCGMTRALVSLLHGEAAKAIAYNAGIVVVAPVLVLVWAKELRRRYRTLIGGG